MKFQRVADAIVAEMNGWVRPTRARANSVALFAIRLPENKLWEALYVAKSRKPSGGMPAWKYFCGVAHSMIREHKGQLARN